MGLAVLTMVVLMLCTVPVESWAEGGCDPLYMQSLKGRARIETLREGARNKNFIYKGDSVLEYSCIFSFLTHAQAHTPIAITPGAWDTIATNPAFNFLAYNFGHVYLGGHFRTGAESIPVGDYFCDAMARMWEFARCINLNQYPNAEGFFDFAWYENTDPRKYPPEYAACIPVVQDIDLRSAFNGLQAQWAMDPAIDPDGAKYPIDPVQTYLGLTSWDTAHGGNGECGAPIPTGLKLYRQTQVYDDYICAKPGCTYVPGTPGKCVQ